jgi:putative SOS response-associated peptidase YedK
MRSRSIPLSPAIHDRLALILHPRDYDLWLGIDDRGGEA